MIRRFLRSESASGVVLLACTVLALAWANSPWTESYFALWSQPLSLGLPGLAMDLRHWVNDGLMAVFFLLIGLDLKHELLSGTLSTRKAAMLPLAAALGGMLVPALVYLSCNAGTETLRGWGIPMATDIAFAVAVLALLGSLVPTGLKVFLVALAVVDDLGAVLVIALFYASDLNLAALGIGAAALAAAALLNRNGVGGLLPYILLGAVSWYFVLSSGVHATIAGVLLALTIPARGRRGGSKQPPLQRLRRQLHVPVLFGIMPLFAIANAGVVLPSDFSVAFGSPVTIGVLLGLLLGKQLGVSLFAWLAVRLGLAQLPTGIDWARLYAVAVICGVGFTMSLFVANLAFVGDVAALEQAKLGILAASMASAAAGYALLSVIARRSKRDAAG